MTTLLLQALRERFGTRWLALRVLATTFPGRPAALGGSSLLSGAMPAGFALCVGAIITSLPAAARAGLNSPDGHATELALFAAAAVLVASEALGIFRAVQSDDLYRRLDEAVLARVMSAVLSPPGIAHLEDPEQQQRVTLALRAARFGPGEFVSGISNKWRTQAAGLAATVLVASSNFPAAIALFIVWQVVGIHLTSARYRAFPFWSEPLKRALYMRDLGLEPHAAKEVRLFGLGDWLVDRYTAAWSEVMRGLWATRTSDLQLTLVLAVLLALMHLAVLWWSATAAANGALSLAQLTILIQGVLGMASLGSLDGDVWIDNGAVAIPSMLALEHELATGRTLRTNAERFRVGQQIRFSSVSFAYLRTSRPILDRLDLEIRAGQSLAIVGANGAGKTTLLKLLLRVYEPTSGEILVDGTPLTALDLSAWRRAIAVIFQDFVRFELTARDNIGFGSLPLLESAQADGALHRAAERSGVLDLVQSLPAGFETMLSRRFAGGVELSGGQWQRIALARALFAIESGANVLVLDEPTAHLDVRAEIELFDRFLELTAGLTTIIVSHRFSTVRRADRIAVIDDGRVVEQGNHTELLQDGGQYAHMFHVQSAAFYA